MENLNIEDQGSSLPLTSRIEVTLWWEFLRPFVAVKNICLSKTVAFRITYTLQALGGGKSLEVLPALQRIFVRPRKVAPPDPSRVGYGQELTGEFVAARHLLGHSTTISVSHLSQ